MIGTHSLWKGSSQALEMLVPMPDSFVLVKADVL